MKIDTSDKIGRWQEVIKAYPPNDYSPWKKKVEKAHVRAEVKKIPFEVGDCCFVCSLHIPEVLHRHHLMVVSDYCHREDINRHLLTLCENHHTLAHRLIYKDKGSISWETVEYLRSTKRPDGESYWSRFVLMDKMSSKALLEIDYTEERDGRSR